jgi:predicted transcriptional regulator
MNASPTGDDNVSVSRLRDAARAMLLAHWRPAGYTVPNLGVYPFQWLWDSCFHAICWAHLGDGDRAVTELRHVFRTQSADGFVPHVDYEADPQHLASFWGRNDASSITQPPMFGHAIAELARLGIDVPAELHERATAGLGFLLDHRTRDDATDLITVVHPWETGMDDSPRWDHWCGGQFDPHRWYQEKGELLRSVVRSRRGSPIENPRFRAAPVSFNALVAFNARELARVTGSSRQLVQAQAIFDALDRRWHDSRRTWIDAGPAEATSGRVRTVDATLAVFGSGAHAPVAMRDVVDDVHYGGAFGPAFVHRDESVFAPRTYWRGSAWPQLTYLLWLAARATASESADRLARTLASGARRSGWAEHWDPDDATPLGARPQSWTALAVVPLLTRRL